MKYKNFGDMPMGEGNGGKPAGIYPLARQSSVYSLTFDEFQNTLGGFGKDFGLMNMDELLKNIWSAEETQSTGGSIPGGNLQRQGSLTLPQTLSQKTVDEVWTDLINESGSCGNRVSNLPQRQQTLGEMTLEEFLVRAGVTREDTQPIGRPNNNGFYGELSRPGLALGFQQPSQNNGFLGNLLVESNNSVPNQLPSLALNVGGVGSSQQQSQWKQQRPIAGPNNTGFYGELSQLNNNGGLALGFQQQRHNNGFLGNRIMESNNSVPSQPSSLAINVGGLGSSQQQQQQQHQNQSQQLQHQIQSQQQQHQIQSQQQQQHQHQSQQHQHQNQNQSQQQRPLFPKQATLAFATTQIANPGARSTTGITDQISADVIVKSNGNTTSLSPAPYVFNRGRKSNGVLEKGVERRQRRMIKNRESAARSRARKQAYTLELEAEITKLKEMNQKLERKQAEVMEIKKTQILETVNRQWGVKRQCLRRTLTGPW